MRPYRDGYPYRRTRLLHTGLLINACFAVALMVLGLLTIDFLHRRRFTLSTGASFLFFVCIAAAALRAAMTMGGQ